MMNSSPLDGFPPISLSNLKNQGKPSFFCSKRHETPGYFMQNSMALWCKGSTSGFEDLCNPIPRSETANVVIGTRLLKKPGNPGSIPGKAVPPGSLNATGYCVVDKDEGRTGGGCSNLTYSSPFVIPHTQVI